MLNVWWMLPRLIRGYTAARAQGRADTKEHLMPVLDGCQCPMIAHRGRGHPAGLFLRASEKVRPQPAPRGVNSRPCCSKSPSSYQSQLLDEASTTAGSSEPVVSKGFDFLIASPVQELRRGFALVSPIEAVSDEGCAVCCFRGRPGDEAESTFPCRACGAKCDPKRPRLSLGFGTSTGTWWRHAVACAAGSTPGQCFRRLSNIRCLSPL